MNVPKHIEVSTKLFLAMELSTANAANRVAQVQVLNNPSEVTEWRSYLAVIARGVVEHKQKVNLLNRQVRRAVFLERIDDGDLARRLKQLKEASSDPKEPSHPQWMLPRRRAHQNEEELDGASKLNETQRTESAYR
jgi:hypothetical protein